MALPGWLSWFNSVYSRIGAPAGASISADITTVDSVVDAIQTDVGDASGSILGSLYAILGNPAQNIDATVKEVQQALNIQLERVSFFNTTTTVINDSVILFQLVGPVDNLILDFFLDDDAAATFTLTLKKTRAGDLVTLVAEAIATIATPAADAHYHYDLGSLAEDQIGQVVIAQDNAGDATNVCDAVIRADI